MTSVMTGLVLLGIIVAIVVWAIGAYNALVALKNRAEAAWNQIDVQLKRRHDLVPNLVETVRGALEYERNTLEAVVAARQKALDAHTPATSATAEQGLSQALGRLFAVVEAYPDLKANQNVLQLQEELTNSENLIAFARQHYNDVVGQYDTRRESFPGNLIANQFGFQPREYFVAPEEERAVPQVKLTGLGTGSKSGA
jgi:LemA protein